MSWEDSDFPELSNAVKLVVVTKCPEKYRLVDTETGEVYEGTNDANPYMPGYMTWRKEV